MIPSIQCSFVSGELSPSFLGRTDKPQYRNGASTMRNMFVRYQGGAYSRAGTAYIGMCKQGAPNAGGTATTNPPRDINFQFNINQGYALEFGDQYMRIKFDGAYVLESGKNVVNITQNNPGLVTIGNHGFSNGDWVFGSGIGGMIEFNGLSWIVQNSASSTFTLTDLFGNTQDTTGFTAFTSGGVFSRVYTVTSPYAAVDLPYLKFVQNANLMNLTCWNQETNSEYAPYTLQRNNNTNWAFTQVSFTVPISPPVTVTAVANNSTTKTTWYSYGVTAVDNNGNESIMSTAADIQNNDISINAGSNIITWSSSGSSVSNYNIYAATPIYSTGGDPGFVGVPYGIIGSAFGQQFIDTNIIRDFTVAPPTHQNPFTRGQIIDVTPTAAGSGLTQAGTSIVFNTSTGSGAIVELVIQNGGLVGNIVLNAGQGYALTDTASISGTGSGATVTLSVGPETGTYPGTCQYYQQRLIYADTINQPDTYFMSQPGLYSNFDTSSPTVDSDAIIGTPWATQINGIQFMVPSIQGLLTFTGNGVWLINGGNSVAITPSDQNAQAQAQIGCSAIVPPLYINLHILYVQAKNSIVRDIAFNFLYNVFQGTDITVFSNHLFLGFTLIQWAYSEEPYKLVWAVRDDGNLLSLTYIKEQEIQGWSRHDTNGLFVGVCSVIEPPVDAIYLIVKRYIVQWQKWAYYAERMDNRIWSNAEDCFCVDSGLTLPVNEPNAILTPVAANGTSNVTGSVLINGGSGYTNPTAQIVDSTGTGSGATLAVTQTGGVLNLPTIIAQGQNYTVGATRIIISDPTGSGAIVQPLITNIVTFNASASVFNAGMVGNIIRVGGGKATITGYNSPTQIIADITQPITATIPNDPNNIPIPAGSGNWSIAIPTSFVSGLVHLNGMTVTGLADGGVIVPQVVKNGVIILQNAASMITVGLPFTAQLQTFPLEMQSQTTVQGRRKTIGAVTARVEASRGFTIGANQEDSANQPNNANVAWVNMKAPPQTNIFNAGNTIQLATGDIRIPITDSWEVEGQVAFQQILPLPMNIVACIGEYTVGDM